MVKLVNRAKMTTSTTGTGTITLGSAVDGFQTFTAAGVSNGETVRYCIEDGTSNFELGSGVFTASGTTLTRVVSESSNSNNAINLSGDAIVFITAIAADIQPTTFTTTVFTATANQTTFTVSYTVGFAEVFLNGSKLSAADFTATNGTSIVLASGATVGDTVDVVAYATQTIANVYTQSQSDARYLQLTGGTLTGDLTGTTSTFSGDVTIADKIVHSGDTNTAIRFPAVDTFTVETDGSERMRVNASGVNVGDITINSSTISDGGDFTIDVGGNIIIDSDGGNVLFKDGGTDYGQIASDSNTKFLFYSAISDGDMVFQGNDGGSTVTALTLDMSDAGSATFNNLIKVGGTTLTGASLTETGTFTISGGTNVVLDAANEVHLDADSGIIRIQDAGGDIGMLRNESNNFTVRSMIGDADLLFKGNDGGSVITALTLDMSAAGAATFNAGANFGGNVISNSQAHDGGVEILAGNNNQSTKLKIQGKSSGGTEHNWFLEVARSADEFRIGDGSSTAMTIDSSLVISDADGKIRAIPQSGSDKTSSYTLTTGDVGNFIGIGSGGSITVPNSTFAAGDAVSIFNNTSGDRTITLSITTAYIAGDNTDKNSVTLATRGVCTILFISGTVCVLSGNVS